MLAKDAILNGLNQHLDYYGEDEIAKLKEMMSDFCDASFEMLMIEANKKSRPENITN